jgi:alpha-galactosidase
MPIEFNENVDTFIIHTQNTSYIFGLGNQDELTNLYWGPRLLYEEDIPFPIQNHGASFTEPRAGDQLEYLMAGGMVNVENCLKVTFPGNIRDIRPKLKNHEIIKNVGRPDRLIVTLNDCDFNVSIKLHYIVYEELDLIERQVEIINHDKQPIQIERIFSALWNLPYYNDYSRLTHCHGRHAHEFQIVQTNLTPGSKVLESRTGTTSHFTNPWVMLDDGNATEDFGDVYFGALKWSGSWKIIVQKTDFNYIRVLGGVNDYDFEWILQPGEGFMSPPFIAGFSAGGFGQASRILHDYQRKYLLPANHRLELRKVIYNSWEVTLFKTFEQDQMKIAEKAAEIGVEIFVMDDGWFGKRNHDRSGLGDWEPNPEKFPNGLQPLIDHVNKLGMEFGLWFEPEMMNLIDTKLYNEHPEWVIQFPNRPAVQGRNQVNLNLALSEVKEYVFNCVDRILTKYPGITYIKWDMNKSICDVPTKDLWVLYVQNLYEVFDRLREKHTHLYIENCSGGGGRMDMGLMQWFDTNWTSDNTNPHDRLQIQEGFSMAYTPKVMSAWVTDAGGKQFSLEYRFHSSMMGILGIGANLYNWTPQNFKVAKTLISQYKQIRHIIQDGDLYRLKSPRSGVITAIQYLAKDKSEFLLFVFKDAEYFESNVYIIHPKNLDPTARYSGNGVMGFMSGKAIMTRGVCVSLIGVYNSTYLHIKRV